MRRLHTVRSAVVMGTICGTLLLASCGAHAKRDWLTFFFDGVPPEKTERQGVAGQPPVAPGPNAGVPADNLVPAAEPARTVHRPYGDRKCDACHESQFSQKLRGKTGEICQLCHKTLFADARFRHAPAEDGECLGCHHPHESAERFLLARKGQQLCLECHDGKDVTGAAAHAGIGETACQGCHDPHGGGDRRFLKPGAKPAPAPAGR